MIDIRYLRENPDQVKQEVARRLGDHGVLLDQLLELDRKRREIIKEVESLKSERNTASSEVARLKKAKEDTSSLINRLGDLSSRIKELDGSLRETEAEISEGLLRVPNRPLAVIPEGDASANRVVRDWGAVPEFDFEALPHWELGDRLGILDLPRGAKVSGSGFPVYRAAGARLVRALRNFMLDLHVAEHGYVEIAPPHLVNEKSATGTGQLPDLENNMYVTTDGDYLIPTAEVPVTNLHADEILDASQLPIGYVAYTPCYRREAGSHGKDTRGIMRVHQFDKVELVRLVDPETSEHELEKILAHAAEVLRRLEIPYRVLELAAGDIGFASARTFDLEVWAGGVDAWLEASSASLFTDFQARRASIRFRRSGDSRPEFVHTLNASGVALPRTMIALLENNQQPDGSVTIPAALQPYVGLERLIPGES